jgi:hypothetical protein
MTEPTQGFLDLKALYGIIRQYVEAFELQTDAGPYTPSPFGRGVMFNCFIELIDTPDFIRAFQKPKLKIAGGAP